MAKKAGSSKRGSSKKGKSKAKLGGVNESAESVSSSQKCSGTLAEGFVDSDNEGTLQDGSETLDDPGNSFASSSTRKALRTPPTKSVEHTGPRPDEELLYGVRQQVYEGNSASVEFIYQLLRSDEEVNQRSVRGLTALAVAAAASNGPLVSLLLERGADVRLTSIDAELPLHYAARCGNRVVCQLLAEPTQAAGLIDVPTATGCPALHLAAAAGHVSTLGVLVRYGADVHSRNHRCGSCTALHAAVQAGHADTAEALLDRDAAVGARDSMDREALHFAAARADYACTSLLLRSRADPSHMGQGKRPQDLVPLAGEGRDRVMTLLAAYTRPSPQPFRTDLRFDKVDPRDVDVL